MHHQLGGSNFASGSSSCSSNINRIQPMEDESGAWHDRAAFVQDFGKAAEFPRPALHKSSSQVPPKLVVTRSSGAQRSLRSRPTLFLPGQWNSLRSFPGSDDGSGPSNMETDTNLGIGLSTRLGLSEVPSLVGHRCTGNSQEYPIGKSGITVGSSSSNLYPGFVSAQSASVPEFGVGRGGSGHVLDTGGFSVNASSGLVGRSHGVASNASYHSRNAVAEGNINNVSFGVAVTSSVPLDRQQRDGQPLIHHGNKSNFSMLPDTLMTGAGNNQVPLGEDASCSSDSLFCFSTGTLDRAQLMENRSPKGSFLGKSISNSSSSASTSSRASACKRKSCTSSAFVNSFCRSGSPYSSGSREAYGMRSMGGNSTGRRSSSTIGCVSASDVVASASAVVAGRCVETSVAASAVEEQRSRKSTIARDGDSLANNRGKFTSGITSTTAPGSRVPGGSATGQLDHLAPKPMFSRAVRRAIPALQPDPWCSRGVPLADCPTETDFATNTANTFVRQADQLIMHGGVRRSGSPSVGSSRSGSTFSSGRIDHTIGSSFGERLPYRYVSTNNRNIMSSASGAGSSIGTETRLRVRNYISASESSIGSAGVVTSPGQILPGAQGAVLTENLAGSSPLRVPPHNPAVRPRPNPSDLHMSMLTSPSSGFNPSRFPTSPPSMPSTFPSTMDMLPSEPSMFNRSLLPRSSVDGRSELGFGSAENLLGFPFRGLPMGDGEHQPRLVAEGLAEILLALDRVERDEDLTYEQLLMLEATLLFGGMGLHDQHSDLRLDVDNMSYEELLALEERIGNVSTGLTPDDVNKRLKKGRYSSQAAIIAGSQESDIKCSVCQEEYEDGDELGKIDCGHSYHIACIKQWLVQKNQCPICKASALS